jgi:hypothetical protein
VGMRSTLKGLSEDATLSGQDLYESATQGWRHKTPPTLGSEILPFQGRLAFGPFCSFPKGEASRSPGLAALFAAYPGKRCGYAVNPEGVEWGCNPFRVGFV